MGYVRKRWRSCECAHVEMDVMTVFGWLSCGGARASSLVWCNNQLVYFDIPLFYFPRTSAEHPSV